MFVIGILFSQGKLSFSATYKMFIYLLYVDP